MKEEILEKIKSQKIKMKPKIAFALRIFGIIAIIVLLAVFAIYLISFILYTNHFSWMLILIALIFIFLIEILMREFRFTYRKPIIYSLILVLLIVILCGFIVHTTPFHSRISCLCHQYQVPIISSLYNQYEKADIPRCNCGSCNFQSPGY
jgi:hypothetical protein